ncbi:hypothetical protein Tco_0631078 [Tanacetum coccineum]
MTSEAQQIALDNELVAPENCHAIGKYNMRINPGMKPKDPTYQVVLDALALTTCYLAFLITAEVPIIYMHQFWATSSEILNICPKVLSKEFDEPPTEDEALSFICKLGHSGEIRYITDVVVDHLHQPWKTFASIINKYLCGKDLAYQIDNIDSKKQDKMFYPLFTKIIIHHFLTKDKSILMRNRMFMHNLGRQIASRKDATTKPKPSKKKALVKADTGKDLNVFSEVALFKAVQVKEVTRRSRKEFHASHASGSGDRTDLGTRVLMSNNARSPIHIKELVLNQGFPI